MAAIRTPDAPSAQRNIVCQICDFGLSLTPLLQLQLIPRDRRTARNVDDMCFNAKRLKCVAQPFGVLPHFLRAVVGLSAACFQKRHGREFIFRLLRLLLADFLRNLGRFQLYIRFLL